MIVQHLGPTIDIHGGGNDLIFPHHENEVAQSTCAHDGQLFVRYWLHNGFVNVDHTKMSKSLGNVLLVRNLLKEAPGEAIRLALLSAHYRQPLDWTGDVLPEARRKLDRLYGALRDVPVAEGEPGQADPEFIAALDDDLNTPKALAVLFDLARSINRSESPAERQELAARLRAEWQPARPAGRGSGGLVAGCRRPRQPHGGGRRSPARRSGWRRARARISPRRIVSGTSWLRTASSSSTGRRARAGGAPGADHGRVVHRRRGARTGRGVRPLRRLGGPLPVHHRPGPPAATVPGNGEDRGAEDQGLPVPGLAGHEGRRATASSSRPSAIPPSCPA